MLTDDESMRFLRRGMGLTPDQAEERFDQFMSEWDESELGFWAIEDRRDGELLGYIGLVPYDAKVGDLDVMIRSARRGRGFATEAVRAVMLYAIDTLRFDRVVGTVHPANRAPQRVMQKVGMSRREDIPDSHGLKMYVYAITAIERRLLSH